MDFTQNSAFCHTTQQKEIPEGTQIVWVSDLFVEDYVGGAELTSEALIESSPFNVFKLKSSEVTMDLLQKGQNLFWVFGNWSQINLDIIPAIIVNMKYAVIEYDYKFCRYRSPEKHENLDLIPCNCSEIDHGKLVAAFYAGAQHLWWMSEAQMDIYHEKFPPLKEGKNTVLSSVFSDKTLATIKLLREANKEKEKKGWIVLGSNSWIKGFEKAKKYCEDNELDYKVLWNVPYEVVLQEISEAEGHVYLPEGNDTCPRMVVEAKLLGAKLILNDFVQHKDEDWFNPLVEDVENHDEDDEIIQIEQYLYAARDWFWNGTKADMEYIPTLSGYTTTRNCISQNYPYEAAISSMLDFCDEVVVMDGGSDDGTYELLEKWALDNPKLKVYRSEMKWDSKRFAIFDGMLKSMAREACTMDYCWQMDSDEIVHETDFEKIQKILRNFPSNIDLLALPVVEFWGGKDKVRMDINPWKWRLSRNKKHIGHGVPGHLRVDEEDGHYSKLGSDGCVTPETKIMTPEGEKQISEIKVGDFVLTHKGRFRKVTRTYKRDYKKWSLFSIHSREFLDNALYITGNHPILFSKYKRHSYSPWRTMLEETTWLSLDDRMPNKNECFVYPKLKIKNEQKFNLNRDLGFLIGLYLGDGCIVKRTEDKEKFKFVSFSLSSYQDNVVNKIENILLNEFGISKIYKKKCNKKNYWDLKVNNANFAKFMYEICKSGSREKILTTDCYNWDESVIWGILEGLYESDGADCKSGINIAMLNGKLLSQIKLLLTKINLYASLISYNKKSSNSYLKEDTDMYQLRITGRQVNNIDFLNQDCKKQRFLENRDFFSIKSGNSSIKIEKTEFEGNLYNLEIEEDHSYVANGITVHNCDYIHRETLEPILFANFYTPENEMIRRQALSNDKIREHYQRWFDNVVEHLPCVYHFSWWDVERKIKTYKNYWQKHWESLFNIKTEDTAENNKFFNKPWSEVSDEEIKEKAIELSEKTGGWIFHNKWKGESIPSLSLKKELPKYIKGWIEK